jgi:rhodanese-related sulfurtransferase
MLMGAKRINQKKAAELISKKQAKLFDVRDPVSFRNGTVMGAKNLALRNVGELRKLPTTTHVIFYDAGMENSDLAMTINYVTQFGFTNLYVLS